jgi:hypothetical protein
MKKWIWTFVVCAAGLDVCFSYVCRDSMLEWESNPVARWAFQSYGLEGVILYRVLLLAFAMAMGFTKTRFSWLVAPTWGAGHAYLLVTLLAVGPYVSVLRTGSCQDSDSRAEVVASEIACSSSHQPSELPSNADIRCCFPSPSPLPGPELQLVAITAQATDQLDLGTRGNSSHQALE